MLASGMNVGVVVIFDAKISKCDMRDAFKLARQEHPFLRICIQTDKETQQKQWMDVDPGFIPIEFTQIADEKQMDDDDSWKQNIINLTAEKRDNSKSMIYLTLSSNKNMNRHVLYSVISHSATDGPGCFYLIESIMYHLGQVLKYKYITNKPEPRSKLPFYDVVGTMLKTYAESPEKYKMPKLSDNFMPKPSSRITADEQKASDDPQVRQSKIFSNWIEFTQQETKLLLTKARSHNTTIQGILSTASIIARVSRYCIDNKDKSIKEIFPSLISVTCPCRMNERVTPKIDKINCCCASTAICWEQKVDLEMKLWDIATEAKQKLTKSFDDGCTFEWMAVLNGKHKTIKAPPDHTVMSSTLGINPIQEKYGDNQEVFVRDVHMMGSAESIIMPPGANGDMVHMHTFNGRLKASVTYVFPGVPHKEGKQYADIHYNVFKAMIDDKIGETVKVKDFVKVE